MIVRIMIVIQYKVKEDWHIEYTNIYHIYYEGTRKHNKYKN